MMNNIELNAIELNSLIIAEGSLEAPSFELDRGVYIRLGFGSLTLQELITVFRGHSANPSLQNNQTIMQLQAYDEMEFLFRTKLPAGDLQIDVTTTEYIQSILEELGYTSDDWIMDTALSTIPFAWWGGRSAATEIRQAVEAEGGRFYVNEDGKFIFENRQHYNLNEEHKISQYDLLPSSYFNIDWNYDPSNIINSVTVKVAPYQEGTVHTHWQRSDIPLIPAGETITVIASFDPVVDIETLTATTDYLANANEDGSGSDLTGDLVVTQQNYVEKAFIEIENTSGSGAYLTLLQLRATPLERANAIDIVSEDATSITAFGKRSIVVNNPYSQDVHYAQTLADFIVGQFSDLGKRAIVKSRANTSFQLGDVVSLTPKDSIENLIMRIIGIKTIFQGSSMDQEVKLREVFDVELLDFFTIGVSEIEGTDVIAP